MSIYDFKVKDSNNNEVSLEEYRGKVLLIVNTATACGLTPQYEALQNLYKKYQDQGFEILDFPCNQFLGQAPGTNEEIVDFCQTKFNTTFKTFGKLEVNGKDADPLYTYLKNEARKERENEGTKGFIEKLKELGQNVIGDAIKWNFTKFLVDQNGNIVGRFSPTFAPEELDNEIAELLNKA